MKTLFSHGLPEVTANMRIEWRVNEITPHRADVLTTVRSHSQCLVDADGTEIATIAKDAVDEVRDLIRQNTPNDAPTGRVE
ncbi:hypothetical protein Ga0100231_023965 [Opitutaceae bacterium TAV4]|nr:hypothetical protein Ga0100231_023965 [Opitutaceae bacterium TAV4]RRK00768.1 hypothetical protein Ga0100230_023540 [Opitutaceae bacterium TAV3]